MKFMKMKKILLAIITIVSLIPVFLSLVDSVHQPQSQSNFQLYQTNLILKSSQIFDSDHQKFNNINKYISGQQPYVNALEKYKEVHDILSNKLSAELNIVDNSTIKTIEKESYLDSLKISSNGKKILTDINKQKRILHKLNLKIGLL